MELKCNPNNKPIFFILSNIFHGHYIHSCSYLILRFMNEMNIFNNFSMCPLVWCYVHWCFHVHKTNERSMPQALTSLLSALLIHDKYFSGLYYITWEDQHGSPNIAIDGLVSNHDCSISTKGITVNKILQWLGPNWLRHW